jgi:hypothetical protein
MSLPDLLPVSGIRERLLRIFPEGTPNRNYCTREMAARTVFVMLYIGALEGESQWLAPKHVFTMSDQQAALQDEHERLEYRANSVKPRYQQVGQRWYADNTREPIRDETLREGLAQVGAVVTRQDVPTTSPLGRYAVAAEFAALFTPQLEGESLRLAIEQWQAANLSAAALMRTRLVQQGSLAVSESILVTFPNAETRRLAPGPSSIISKAVIEEFAPRFLVQPAVVLLSESGNKIVSRDDGLAQSIGLKIEADRLLPDIVLVDLDRRGLLLVFVEVVASDGPISESRKLALLDLAAGTGLPEQQIAFVTAYLDRSHPAFRRTVSALAWQSFAWFVAEPWNIVLLREGESSETTNLADLQRRL